MYYVQVVLIRNKMKFIELKLIAILLLLYKKNSLLTKMNARREIDLFSIIMIIFHSVQTSNVSRTIELKALCCYKMIII